jgi:hypothetical protein
MRHCGDLLQKCLRAHPDFDPVENDLDVVRDNLYAYALLLGIGCAICSSTGSASSASASCQYCSTNGRAIGLGAIRPLPMEAPIEAQGRISR